MVIEMEKVAVAFNRLGLERATEPFKLLVEIPTGPIISLEILDAITRERENMARSRRRDERSLTTKKLNSQLAGFLNDRVQLALESLDQNITVDQTRTVLKIIDYNRI